VKKKKLFAGWGGKFYTWRFHGDFMVQKIKKLSKKVKKW
jgi:hypothetical protein